MVDCGAVKCIGTSHSKSACNAGDRPMEWYTEGLKRAGKEFLDPYYI